MGEKHKKKAEKSDGKIKIILSIMLLIVLLMVELYIMINDSENFLFIGILLVLMLVFTYLSVTSVLEQGKKREEKIIERYDNIFKAEKASYLQLRKHHADVEKRLENIESNLKVPKDEIITIQKAIAKITINQSKENADALMNSNDMLMQKLYDFEDLLKESNNKLLEEQKEIFDSYVAQISGKQSELETLLKETESTVEKEIAYEEVKADIEEKIEEVPETVEEPILEISKEEIETPIPELMEEEVVEEAEPELPKEEIETPMPELMEEEEPEETEPEIPKEEIETPMPEIMEEPIPEPVVVETENIDTKTKNLKSTEQAMDELLRAVSQPIVHAETEAIPEPEPQVMPEAIPEPEVVPTLNSDPNHKMTPEEIAALISNM